MFFDRSLFNSSLTNWTISCLIIKWVLSNSCNTMPRLVESICKIRARMEGSQRTSTPLLAVGIVTLEYHHLLMSTGTSTFTTTSPSQPNMTAESDGNPEKGAPDASNGKSTQLADSAPSTPLPEDKNGENAPTNGSSAATLHDDEARKVPEASHKHSKNGNGTASGDHDELDKGSDSEDEESEDEDEPPILKYTRLNQLPPKLFKHDPVSTTAFYDTIFIFGTHTGWIYLIKPDLTVLRSFKAHRASVLSLYSDGQFFASGSMDGTIVIGSITDERDLTLFDYKRPIHAVVLEKNYARNRSFVCGGMSGQVIYSAKNWLEKRVDTILDQDNGPIVGIQTIDDLVLWMNDKGITIYHTTTRRVISNIPKPDDSHRSDLYWPRVCFPETDRTVIAWGNYIWSLRTSIKGANLNTGAGSSVKSRILPGAASLSFRSAQEKKIDVEHVFKVDYLISGIQSFRNDNWIILAYNEPERDEDTGRLVAQNPDIKLLSTLDGATVHEEEIGLESTENLGLNDYTLGCHIGTDSTRFFIISARDGVIAEQIQMDDRLKWYLDRKMYLEAWTMSQHLVAPVQRLSFGVNHLESLVRNDKWDEATEWLSKLLYLNAEDFPGGDTKSTLATRASNTLQAEERELFVREVASQWVQWSDIFISSNQVERLTTVIPKDPRWNLPKGVFVRILKYWLDNDNIDAFCDSIDEWPLEIYDVGTITSAVEHVLELQPENAKLRRKLCDLYTRALEPTKAVKHLCELKDPNIIPFLDTHHILQAFVSEIPDFAKLRFSNDSDIDRLPIPELEQKLADITQILVKTRHEIAPERVLQLMTDSRLDILNFFYLEQLAGIDELLVKGYENTLINLYSQFDRPKLLPFLMTNNNYDISKAIEVCELNALVDELVFLLGKIGENKKALKLIMEELDDPRRAIKFAKTLNDKETWNILLEYSFSRPAYIRALIELADNHSNNFYNPITILEKMNTDVDIEGLKESITKVSLDNDTNITMNQLILRIIHKRSEEVSKMYYQDKLKGIEIDASDNKLKLLFDVYETVVLVRDPSSSLPRIALVNEVVEGDRYALRLSTTLKQKLQHLEELNELYRRKLETK